MDARTPRTSTRACDACRVRKLRCEYTVQNASGPDVNHLKCSHCVQTNVHCTFILGHRKGGPKKGKILSALQAYHPTSTSCSAPVSHSWSSENSLDSSILPSNLALSRCDCWNAEPSTTLSSDDLIDSVVSANTEEHLLASYSGHMLTGRHISNDNQPGSSYPVLHSTHVSLPSSTLRTVPENFTHSMAKSHHMALKDIFPFSKDELFAEIAIFVVDAYECYPIMKMDTVIKNVLEDRHLSDPDFSTLALSIVMMNAALQFRRSPQDGTARLDAIIKIIGSIRFNAHDCSFTDMPSLDTVTVSWCLFMACIFLGKYYKGFAYLTEAIGFLDLVPDTLERDEVVRLHRLEYMLFITESGGVSLYGPSGKRRIARCPPPFDSAEALLFSYHDNNRLKELGLQNLVVADIQAVELMLMMGRLHAALCPDDVVLVTIDQRSMAPKSGISIEEVKSGKAVSTQMADVVITRQWKLGWHWKALFGDSTKSTQHKATVSSMLQTLGMTTLQWVKNLTSEQLRVINPGKLVALMDAIIHIASAIEETSCTNIIGDLIRSVYKVDYERAFVMQLSLFESSITRIPWMIGWNEDHHYEIGQDQLLEDARISTNSADQVSLY